jgi:hypothetical protein
MTPSRRIYFALEALDPRFPNLNYFPAPQIAAQKSNILVSVTTNAVRALNAQSRNAALSTSQNRNQIQNRNFSLFLFSAHLLLIAHRNLNKHHRELSGIGLGVVRAFAAGLEHRLDSLKLDPETANAKNEAVGALDQEENDARICQELQRRRQVLESDAHPRSVCGGEEPLDGEQVWHVDDEVPALEVRGDIDGEEEHGQDEECAEAAV